ncbi:glutathione S-transferase [Planoprotostelium fungivorum]|uniref:Glutathione S-transferase n=1 Tax=Planoprotostelium fungivorum TaxID=1890364 RepID=A0A2P6N0P9_9EUKA|nr:glutathione S-transferase [Planoprotostelium fungivorum]
MTTPHITFYDIASAAPVRTFAPNPWKTRLALNYKGVDYETVFVPLMDVEKVRRDLDVPPCRLYPDGSSFYTLPIIRDHHHQIIKGDSFDIALYLDDKYPHLPRLIPPSSISIHAAFNQFVDTVFTRSGVSHLFKMPLDATTIQVFQKKMMDKFNIPWGMVTTAEQEKKDVETFKSNLNDLANVFRCRDEGPFLEGACLSYADLIVGGWLMMIEETFSKWDEMRGWHGGLWGRLSDALDKYKEIN